MQGWFFKNADEAMKFWEEVIYKEAITLKERIAIAERMGHKLSSDQIEDLMKAKNILKVEPKKKAS